MEHEGLSLEQRVFAVFKTPDDFDPRIRLANERVWANGDAYMLEAQELFDAIDDRKWEDTPLEFFTGFDPSPVWLHGDALLYYFPCFLLALLREPDDSFMLGRVLGHLRSSRREPWRHENIVLMAKLTDDKIAVVVDVVRFALKHLNVDMEEKRKKRFSASLDLFVEGIAQHRSNPPQQSA